MESKPRRGRLRRWAALLAVLLCRGGAWVRRAAAALRNRLGRRRVAFFVVNPRGPRAEARSARTARAHSNRAAAQEERRGSSPSTRARRLPGHRAHGEVAGATTLGPGKDAATSPGDHPKDGEQGGVISIATPPSPTAGNGRASSPPAAARVPDKDGEQGGSRGNADHKNPQGRRQEGGESPWGGALGEKTRNNGKNVEHDVEDNDGAKANGEDATAEGTALGWYPGCEPTKTGDRGVGVAPGDVTHRKHGDPDVGDDQDGDKAGRSKNSSAPRAGMAPEEGKLEHGGGTIAGPKTFDTGEDTVGQNTQCAISIAAPASPTAGKGRASSLPAAARVPDEEKKTDHSEATNGASAAIQQFPPLPVAHQAEDVDGAEEADGHGGCSGGERAQTGEPSVAPGPAKEECRATIDAPVGGSDAVLVQPGLAAAPAGGSGNVRDTSSRGRGRPRRPVRRKKAAAPSPDPLVPIDVEGAVDINEDEEVKLHQTYRDKVAICRKHYTYCLICHLENRETELQENQKKIVKHDKDAHGCPGILCIKTGCFARAKCKRDIRIHQYVCHKI